MRRALRPRSFIAYAVCAAFFAQSTGAADFAPAMARGMMLPPPGVMAPMRLPAPARAAPPKAVKPAGETWLASAAVVARWITERLTQTPALETAPRADELAALASSARVEAVVMAAAPAPEPPADRMLIAMEGRRLLASGLAAQLSSILQYRSELLPLRPRFVGEWVGRGPVRARVDYMKPVGVTQGEAKGFRVTLSDGYERLLPARGRVVPEPLMREVPLYFAGDSIGVEVTIVNSGETALADLRVTSVEENFVASGGEGAPLGSPAQNEIKSLAPGQSATLRWRIQLSSEGTDAVNFEQTHLRVLGRDTAGAEKVVLDEAQAGIVDPPAI